MKLLPKDTLNSKKVPECEMVHLFSKGWEKTRYHWRKNTSMFSWANSVIIKHLFIVCFL